MAKQILFLLYIILSSNIFADSRPVAHKEYNGGKGGRRPPFHFVELPSTIARFKAENLNGKFCSEEKEGFTVGSRAPTECFFYLTDEKSGKKMSVAPMSEKYLGTDPVSFETDKSMNLYNFNSSPILEGEIVKCIGFNAKIQRVPPGKYLLNASCNGQETITKSVTVTD